MAIAKVVMTIAVEVDVISCKRAAPASSAVPIAKRDSLRGGPITTQAV
jgi:hypothetical protein